MKGASGGGGGQPNDVRAGGAFVEISARDRLTAQLGVIAGKASGFGRKLKEVGAVVSGALQPAGWKTMLAGLAAMTPLAALFKGGLNRAEEASKMAEELGVSVEQMQRLKYAADVAAVSVEDVLRKPEQFAGLMGGATVLDAGQIREAVEAQRLMRAAWIDLQGAMAPLLATVTPLVRAFSEFVRANSSWLPVLAAGAAGLTALGAALYAIGPAITAVGIGFRVFGRSMWLVVEASVAMLSKTGLILGAVGGLAALILTTTASGRQMAGDLGGGFERVGQTFGAMLTGITGAIKAGDFDKAFKVFAAGIEAVWYEMLLNMARAFSTFIEGNRDRLIALGSLIGGLKGAGMGGRFGPWGALIGGGIGAVGGGVAVDQLAKLIDGIATNTGMEQRREDAQKRLKALAAAGNPVAPPAQEEALAKRITAVRGAFRKLSDANQQFGASDTLETTQKQALQELRKNNAKLDKLLDAMRLK